MQQKLVKMHWSCPLKTETPKAIEHTGNASSRITCMQSEKIISGMKKALVYSAQDNANFKTTIWCQKAIDMLTKVKSSVPLHSQKDSPSNQTGEKG